MTYDLDDLRFGGNAVYVPEVDVLALSDLHVGLEEALRSRGMSMPLHEADTLDERIEEVVERFEPSTVVLNGDVHHSFGELGDAGDTIRRLARTVDDEGAEPVFVEGNHDTMLDSVVSTTRRFRENSVVFLHGHEMPADLPDAELYVVGHDHPTVEIEMEENDCFLYGDFRGSNVVMTPAFNPLCSGVAVNHMQSRDFMSPFVRGFDGFRVIVENDDGEILRFPTIEEFRGML